MLWRVVKMNNIEELQNVIGYSFNNINLLTQALTHISFANDNNVESYERLEFLGDAVIELIVSEYIYESLPITAGDLTRLRASLVSTDYLSKISIKLELDKKARKSKSLQQLGKKNIADLFESLVGAIYLDGGFGAAKSIIMKYVIIDNNNIAFVIKNSIDYKSRLQEYMQGNGSKFEYVLLSSSGPDHQREFEVALVIEGNNTVVAKASSIQHAEEKCAEEYCNRFLNINTYAK